MREMAYFKVLKVAIPGKSFHIVWGPCSKFSSSVLNNFSLPFAVVLDAVSVAEVQKGNKIVCKSSWGKAVCNLAKQTGTIAQIEDFDVQPELVFTELLLRAYKAVVTGNYRTLVVCCRAGVGRSSTFVYAFLQLLTGKPFYEFVKEVCEKTAVYDENKLQPVEFNNLIEKCQQMLPEAQSMLGGELSINLLEPTAELIRKHVDGFIKAMNEIGITDPTVLAKMFLSPQYQYLLSLSSLFQLS